MALNQKQFRSTAKAASAGRKILSDEMGISAIEVMIALAIIAVSISSAILVALGNQKISVDSELSNQAIYKLQNVVESARAASRGNFASVISTTTVDHIFNITSTETLTVTDISPCKKNINARIDWLSEKRPQTIEISSALGSVDAAKAMGGDCKLSPPGSNWNNPQAFAVDTFSPGKP